MDARTRKHKLHFFEHCPLFNNTITVQSELNLQSMYTSQTNNLFTLQQLTVQQLYNLTLYFTTYTID